MAVSSAVFASFGEETEEAAGACRAQLMLVAYQHELGPGSFHQVHERRQVSGRDHRSLVAHDHFARAENGLAPPGVHEEPGQGVSAYTCLLGEHARSNRREGDATHRCP